LRARVGEHSLRLAREHGRLAEFAARRDVQ
jgi:hypothetical protein